MRLCSILFAFVLLAAGAAGAMADEVDEANAIRERIESYVAAYNGQDAAAVAERHRKHAPQDVEVGETEATLRSGPGRSRTGRAHGQRRTTL